MIFGSKSVIVLKKKIKSYCDKVTHINDKEMPKTGSNCTYFAVILIDLARFLINSQCQL